jgi:AmmeMemoRadiSam system protein B
MIDREPAVAGRFYPRERERLEAEVARLLGEAGAAPRRVIGVLAPHAGYVYSGAVAGATYARVDVPARAIVLGPNHTGMGVRCALWPGGAFKTPLGPVPVDAALTASLRACALVEEDRAAHLREHALEVQLPLLQARRPDVAIAALCLGPLSAAECEEVGRAVARAAREHGALVVASSDMSHYEPAETARQHDLHALERFLALDARGLHERVRGEDISMCGVVPATVMLAAARELGAARAELVMYANSGDVNGDRESVVGYAGAIVE